MPKDLIHVYLMPGMGANPSIFENIKLPDDTFKIHLLEWMLPDNNETLSAYAKRMVNTIQHENPVLLGVSFGGILVQEMSRHIKLRKLIVVSSVKTKHELPKRMKLAKKTRAYKLVPTSIFGNIDFLAKYSFGKTMTKKVNLYKKYMSVSDKRYLDWAIEQVLNWNQENPIKDTIHIHGDKDTVFPFKHLKNPITIKGGTHIMIINKYKWFNENLPKLILS